MNEQVIKRLSSPQITNIHNGFNRATWAHKIVKLGTVQKE